MEIDVRKRNSKLKEKIKSAYKRGIDCTLNDRDMIVLYDRNPGFCEYTGLAFGDDPDFRPSIERIDSTQGYVRGNICLVSTLANSLKNSLLDQKDASQFTLTKDKRALLGRMDRALTSEYLEKLKYKYHPSNPRPKDLMETIDYLTSIPLEESFIPSYIDRVTVVKTKTGTKIMTPETQNTELRVASYLVALSKTAVQLETPFELSFAELKVVFKRKRCAFSRELLENNDHKFILIKDKTLPLSKDNITMVHERFATVLEEFSGKMGLSLEQLTKNFKSFI